MCYSDVLSCWQECRAMQALLFIISVLTVCRAGLLGCNSNMALFPPANNGTRADHTESFNWTSPDARDGGKSEDKWTSGTPFDDDVTFPPRPGFPSVAGATVNVVDDAWLEIGRLWSYLEKRHSSGRLPSIWPEQQQESLLASWSRRQRQLLLCNPSPLLCASLVWRAH